MLPGHVFTNTGSIYFTLLSILLISFRSSHKWHYALSSETSQMYFVISYKTCKYKNPIDWSIYGSLIPLFIDANFSLIIRLIKTKRSKLTLSQTLFSTLFESDLTFGVVQIPSKIYLLWKSSEPTCFEVQVSAFSMPFPICMSFNLLCV